MFQGSIVALITPFRQGQLDEAALARLVEWHIEQGTHGIVPVGTTGESPTLTHDEHCRVVELVVKLVAGRIPVIAGAGSNNPVEAIEYTRYAEQMGADATLHVAGNYTAPIRKGSITTSRRCTTPPPNPSSSTTFRPAPSLTCSRRPWPVWPSCRALPA